MTRLLHLRSIRAAIAKGERRKAKLLDQLLELENEIDDLLAKLPAAERAAIEEARRTIPDQWGVVIKPDTCEQIGGYKEPLRDVGVGANPETHEQSEVGYELTLDTPYIICDAPECPVHHGGSAPYCPLLAEAVVKPMGEQFAQKVDAAITRFAEQASGTAAFPEVDAVTLIDAAAQSVGTEASPVTERDIRDAVDKMKAMPELQMPPVLVVPLVDLVATPLTEDTAFGLPPRKRGRPRKAKPDFDCGVAECPIHHGGSAPYCPALVNNIIGLACPHGIEQPHGHTDDGSTITCQYP